MLAPASEVKYVVKCPFCGYESVLEDFKIQKEWRFRFYKVYRLKCPKCKGIFNYYYGVSPKTGEKKSFTVRVKPASGSVRR